MPLTSLIENRMQWIGLNRSSLAAHSRISRPTLRQVMQGRGTICSLSCVLPHLELAWSWCPPSCPEPGAALVGLRKKRKLTQAEAAARVSLSRPVIISIEKRLRGELASLRAYTRLLGFPLPVAPIAAKRRLIPAPDAPERDRVMTPPALARAICEHFAPHMHGLVLDPARGDGAFHDNVPAHLDRDWCEIADGRDFMAWPHRADWIVTNPPWSRLGDFLTHAMTLADNIVFVAPLPNLTTKARLRAMHEAGFGLAELVQFDTPREWPQSGFQMVAAWISREHAGSCGLSRLAQPGAAG